MDSKFKERILFYGTPSFAVGVLERLIEQDFNVIGVVTMPDKVQGRGKTFLPSAVKKYAQSVNLEILQPTNLKSQDFQEDLKRLNPDVQVVVAFRMLPEIVWDYPKLGTYNVHASLLPDYRGAAPINWVLYNGEKNTGVTTFKLKHAIDTGDIALQKEVSIAENDNFETLYNKLAQLGAIAMVETLQLLFKGDLKLRQQDNIPLIHQAPKISKEDLFINITTSKEVLNKIRAFSPYPGARLKLEKNNFIKFISAKRVKKEEINELKIGAKKHILGDYEFFTKNSRIFISCLDTWLELLVLQIPNKKAMTAQEIMNGRNLFN